MKILIVKNAKISYEGREMTRPDGSDLTVKSLLEDILNNRPQTGFNVSEMSERLKVLGKIKATPGFEILLEDAEAAKLQECARQMSWGFMHEDILGLCKAIDEMKPAPEKKK